MISKKNIIVSSIVAFNLLYPNQIDVKKEEEKTGFEDISAQLTFKIEDEVKGLGNYSVEELKDRKTKIPLLFMAVKYDKIKVFKKLLDKGLDVNEKFEGKSLLDFIVEHNVKFLDLYIENKGEVLNLYENKLAITTISNEKYAPELIKILDNLNENEENIKNIQEEDKKGVSFLKEIIKKGNVKILEYLISKNYTISGDENKIIEYTVKTNPKKLKYVLKMLETNTRVFHPIKEKNIFSIIEQSISNPLVQEKKLYKEIFNELEKRGLLFELFIKVSNGKSEFEKMIDKRQRYYLDELLKTDKKISSSILQYAIKSNYPYLEELSKVINLESADGKDNLVHILIKNKLSKDILKEVDLNNFNNLNEDKRHYLHEMIKNNDVEMADILEKRKPYLENTQGIYTYAIRENAPFLEVLFEREVFKQIKPNDDFLFFLLSNKEIADTNKVYVVEKYIKRYIKNDEDLENIFYKKNKYDISIIDIIKMYLNDSKDLTLKLNSLKNTKDKTIFEKIRKNEKYNKEDLKDIFYNNKYQQNIVEAAYISDYKYKHQLFKELIKENEVFSVMVENLKEIRKNEITKAKISNSKIKTLDNYSFRTNYKNIEKYEGDLQKLVIFAPKLLYKINKNIIRNNQEKILRDLIKNGEEEILTNLIRDEIIKIESNSMVKKYAYDNKQWSILSMFDEYTSDVMFPTKENYPYIVKMLKMDSSKKLFANLYKITIDEEIAKELVKREEFEVLQFIDKNLINPYVKNALLEKIKKDIKFSRFIALEKYIATGIIYNYSKEFLEETLDNKYRYIVDTFIKEMPIKNDKKYEQMFKVLISQNKIKQLEDLSQVLDKLKLTEEFKTNFIEQNQVSLYSNYLDYLLQTKQTISDKNIRYILNKDMSPLINKIVRRGQVNFDFKNEIQKEIFKDIIKLDKNNTLFSYVQEEYFKEVGITKDIVKLSVKYPEKLQLFLETYQYNKQVIEKVLVWLLEEKPTNEIIDIILNRFPQVLEIDLFTPKEDGETILEMLSSDEYQRQLVKFFTRQLKLLNNEQKSKLIKKIVLNTKIDYFKKIAPLIKEYAKEIEVLDILIGDNKIEHFEFGLVHNLGKLSNTTIYKYLEHKEVSNDKKVDFVKKRIVPRSGVEQMVLVGNVTMLDYIIKYGKKELFNGIYNKYNSVNKDILLKDYNLISKMLLNNKEEYIQIANRLYENNKTILNHSIEFTKDILKSKSDYVLNIMIKDENFNVDDTREIKELVLLYNDINIVKQYYSMGYRFDETYQQFIIDNKLSAEIEKYYLEGQEWYNVAYFYAKKYYTYSIGFILVLLSLIGFAFYRKRKSKKSNKNNEPQNDNLPKEELKQEIKEEIEDVIEEVVEKAQDVVQKTETIEEVVQLEEEILQEGIEEVVEEEIVKEIIELEEEKEEPTKRRGRPKKTETKEETKPVTEKVVKEENKKEPTKRRGRPKKAETKQETKNATKKVVKEKKEDKKESTKRRGRPKKTKGDEDNE